MRATESDDDVPACYAWIGNGRHYWVRLTHVALAGAA
jgi:hypothetical protein